jgi:hypothetical protein
VFPTVHQALLSIVKLSGLSNEYVLHCKEFLDGLSQIDSAAVSSSMKDVREHGLSVLPNSQLTTI